MVDRNSKSPWPPHVANLFKNTREVDALIAIHRSFTRGKAGRPQKALAVLHKSAVVLLVACWEAYVEDLARTAFDEIFSRASSPDIFPGSVLSVAGRPLKEDKDDRRVWDLAGDGWKQVIQRYKETVLEEYIGRLNTPRPSQVDSLFERLIGLKRLSSCWRWTGMSNQRVLDRLNQLIDLRGEIAHRVEASRRIYKKEVDDYSQFINRLAAVSSNAVLDFVRERTGLEPWARVVYGKTK